MYYGMRNKSEDPDTVDQAGADSVISGADPGFG